MKEEWPNPIDAADVLHLLEKYPEVDMITAVRFKGMVWIGLRHDKRKSYADAFLTKKGFAELKRLLPKSVVVLEEDNEG